MSEWKQKEVLEAQKAEKAQPKYLHQTPEER